MRADRCGPVKAALAQLDATVGDKTKNLKKLERAVAAAKADVTAGVRAHSVPQRG